MNERNPSIKVAAIALFVAACTVGCHGGDLAGTGSACSAALPCRAAFVCLQSRCEIDSSGANKDAAAPMEERDADAFDAEGDLQEESSVTPDADEPRGGSDAHASDAGDARDATAVRDAAATFDASNGAAPEVDPDADVRGDADASEAGRTLSCDPQAPFVVTTPVMGLDDDPAYAGVAYDNRNGRLSADERMIYFGSNRSNDDFMVYSATRATSTGLFGAPQPVTSINDGYTGSPTMTGDGLTMYLDSTRSGQWSIWYSMRAMADATWPTPVSLVAQAAFVATSADAGPYILPDGNTLYFHSTRLDGTNHLFRTTRTTQAFPEATLIVNTVSSAQEVQAVVSTDDLTLYFGTDRLDGSSKGGFDIWVSSRASTTDDFGPPHDVQELNTVENEIPSWISVDQCRLYFERNDGDVGRFYVASRQNPAASDGDRD